MDAFSFEIAPIIVVLWVMATPCLVIAIRSSFESAIGVIRLLSFNVMILAIFCTLWYLGYYLSEHWVRVIDLGAPWSWFGVLISASFAVSFWQFRKQSNRIAKSLVGPVITAPAFYLWIVLCILEFDKIWCE